MTRSSARIGVVALLAGVLAPAWANPWSPYASAFPSLPCQDGWAACIVMNAMMTSAPLRDGAGHPIPADARIGWFDLAPTATFSPFTALSPYSGPIGAQVAAAPPEPAAPPPEPEAPSEPAAAPEAAPAEPEAVAVNTPTSRPTPTSMPSPTPTASPSSPSSPSTPPPRPTSMPPPTPSSSPTATPTAKTSPSSPSSPTNMPPPTPTSSPTPPPTPTAPVAIAPPVASTDDSCNDLIKIEPLAMMGTLRVGQIKCVEGRIASEGVQTTRDKLSRVLIANAESKGDKAEWERLMKRHLEDIDRSDPDLCFKYALQLSRGGVSRSLGVIRWADYALDNKQKWSGNTYTTRVYNLYRLKAEAANKLWQDAESTYMTKDHTDENEALAAKWRGTTKDYAREWLDYAKASSQDTKNPMAICVSAAGNKQFCEG